MHPHLHGAPSKRIVGQIAGFNARVRGMAVGPRNVFIRGVAVARIAPCLGPAAKRWHFGLWRMRRRNGLIAVLDRVVVIWSDSCLKVLPLGGWARPEIDGGVFHRARSDAVFARKIHTLQLR